MSQIRVIARAVAKAGKEADLHDLLRGMLIPTRAEPGCEFYELYQSHEPERFYFHELWADREAFDRHLETSHFRHLVASAAGLIAAPLEVNFVQAVPA